MALMGHYALRLRQTITTRTRGSDGDRVLARGLLMSAEEILQERGAHHAIQIRHGNQVYQAASPCMMHPTPSN